MLTTKKINVFSNALVFFLKHSKRLRLKKMKNIKYMKTKDDLSINDELIVAIKKKVKNNQKQTLVFFSIYTRLKKIFFS